MSRLWFYNFVMLDFKNHLILKKHEKVKIKGT